MYQWQFSPVDSSLQFALTDCPALFVAARSLFGIHSRLLRQNKAAIVTCLAPHTHTHCSRNKHITSPVVIKEEFERKYILPMPGLNPLMPNDHYSGRTAPLTSKRCILYIYSTNIGTEYFKRGIYSPFYSLQNAVCFIILTYSVPVLVTFYIQSVLKFKKIIPTPKG